MTQDDSAPDLQRTGNLGCCIAGTSHQVMVTPTEIAQSMTNDSILSRIEQSRTERVDLSLRNPLLNYKLLKSKGG